MRGTDNVNRKLTCLCNRNRSKTINSTVNAKGNSTCDVKITCKITIDITNKSNDTRKINRDLFIRYVLVGKISIRVMAVYIALVIPFVVLR